MERVDGIDNVFLYRSGDEWCVWVMSECIIQAARAHTRSYYCRQQQHKLPTTMMHQIFIFWIVLRQSFANSWIIWQSHTLQHVKQPWQCSRLFHSPAKRRHGLDLPPRVWSMTWWNDRQARAEVERIFVTKIGYDTMYMIWFIRLDFFCQFGCVFFRIVSVLFLHVDMNCLCVGVVVVACCLHSFIWCAYFVALLLSVTIVFWK